MGRGAAQRRVSGPTCELNGRFQFDENTARTPDGRAGVRDYRGRSVARPGGSALDARTVRHSGYAISQWIRKRVEEAFGWMKTVGGPRRTRYRGRARVQMHAYLVAAAYNLIRIAKLSPAPA
jgi:IS5 family transposase